MMLTAAQTFCFFFGLMMIRGIQQEFTLSVDRLGADIMIYPTQAMSRIDKRSILMQGTPVGIYKPLSMLSRLEDCEGIRAVTRQLYLLDTTNPENPIWIIGIEPETDFVISPWLQEGSAKDIKDGTAAVGADVIVSGTDTIQLFDTEFPVSARIDSTGSALDGYVFVNMEMLDQLFTLADSANGMNTKPDINETWSAVLIDAESENQIDSVTNWINIYIRKVNAIRNEQTLSGTASESKKQEKVIVFSAAFIWFLLSAAQFIVQSFVVRERKKEFRVWRVIGTSVSKISQVMQTESALVSISGAAAGILIGSVFLVVSGHKNFPNTGIPWNSFILAAAAALLLSLFIGWIGTVISTHRCTKYSEKDMILHY